MKTVFGIFLPVAMLGISAPTAGAQEDYSRRIEVTKEYAPRMSEPDKLYTSPRMTDTVRMQPSLEYSIGTVPWKTVFRAQTLPPVGISPAFYSVRRSFFVRAGGSWPAGSMLDMRYSPAVTRDGHSVLWISHDGRYPHLRTDTGEKLRAMRMSNAAGFRAERTFGRRRLTAEAEYCNFRYDVYGLFRFPGAVYETPSDRRIGYNDVRAHVSFGDGFTDLSRFGFRVAAEGGYFAGRSSDGQYEIRLSAAAGKEFSGHTLMLEASYDVTEGLSALSYYHNSCLELNPEWETEWGILGVKVGVSLEAAQVRYAPGAKEKHFEVFPDAELKLSVSPGFNPYVQAEGGEITGDYRSVVLRNPYVLGASSAPDAHHWTFGGGIRGTLGGRVDYGLCASYSIFEDYFYFLNATSPGQLGRFAVRWSDIKVLSAGLNINAALACGLSLRLKALYAEDFEDSAADVYGIPRISGSVRLHYETPRFYAWVGGDFTGRTPCGILVGGEVRRETVSSAFDLGMGVGCNLKSGVGLFAEAGNLLDRRIYFFNHYPGERLNISAGVSVTF